MKTIYSLINTEVEDRPDLQSNLCQKAVFGPEGLSKCPKGKINCDFVYFSLSLKKKKKKKVSQACHVTGPNTLYGYFTSCLIQNSGVLKIHWSKVKY